MRPFTIRDAQGNRRGLHAGPFGTLEEAIERGPETVNMSRDLYPEEFPFSVIDERTGETVHQWDL
jgi:hypothetical protein